MAILADALYGVADAQMLVARLHAVARKSNHAYIEQAINRLVSGRSVTTAPSASDATVAAAPATPLMTAPSAGDAAVTAAPTIQAIP